MKTPPKIVFFLFMYGFLSHAMSGYNHHLPSLHCLYENQKTVIRIASISTWRSNNSYGSCKSQLEDVLIAHPENALEYLSVRCDRIFGFHGCSIDENELREFVHPVIEKNVLGNHYTLMKECRNKFCPLTRSMSNQTRTSFENELVENIKQQFTRGARLKYVGFATGFNFLGDLRILMQLKKEGYLFEKIQFIDPVFGAVIDFVKNPNNLDADHKLAINVQKLIYDIRMSPSAYFNKIKLAVIAQFLSILSAYDGDDVVEIYPNVKTFLDDPSNALNQADIITSFDMIDPAHYLNNSDNLKKINADFLSLKMAHSNALVGFLGITSMTTAKEHTAQEWKLVVQAEIASKKWRMSQKKTIEFKVGSKSISRL